MSHNETKRMHLAEVIMEAERFLERAKEFRAELESEGHGYHCSSALSATTAYRSSLDLSLALAFWRRNRNLP